MIDELKLLIEAVAGLPTLMVWVLVGFLAYKLALEIANNDIDSVTATYLAMERAK